jgi:hypothetical protein
MEAEPATGSTGLILSEEECTAFGHTPHRHIEIIKVEENTEAPVIN